MKFRIDLKILFFLVLFFITGQLKLYLLVMLFALLHELAHLLMGILLHFRPEEIEIMPFGFWMSLKPRIEDFKKCILKSNLVELKYIFIAAAGPLLNFILIIVFSNSNLISGDMLNRSDPIFTFRQMAIYSNFLLFMLNLVPIYPLDGGRIFQSILRIFIGKKHADESMNIIANVSIIILTIAGSIAILYLKNIAVLLILAYLWELVIRENRRFKLKKKVFEIA